MATVKIKRPSDRIPFWLLLGPVMLFFTLYLGLTQGPTDMGWVLPFSLLAGTYFCWRWKQKGWGISLFFLLGAAFLAKKEPLSGGLALWYFSWWLTLGMGLWLTSLGLGKARSELGEMEASLSSYLENYLRAEETLKNQDKRFSEEKQQAKQQIEHTQTLLEKSKREAHAKGALLSAAKQEVESSQEKLAHLQHELLIKRAMEQKSGKEEGVEKSSLGEPHHLVKREKILAAKADQEQTKVALLLPNSMMGRSHPTVVSLSALRGRVQNLLFSVTQQSSDLMHTKDKVKGLQAGGQVFKQLPEYLQIKGLVKEAISKEKQYSLQKDLLDKTEEIQSAWKEVQKWEEKGAAQELMVQDLQKKLQAVQEDAEKLQAEANTAKEYKTLAETRLQELSDLRKERKKGVNTSASSLEQTFLMKSKKFLKEEVQRLKEKQDLHRQLKRQFQEKTEVLDKTREELFQVETELLAEKLKKEELSLKAYTPLRGFEGEMAALLLEKEEMSREIEELHSVISHLVALPTD